MMSRNWIQITVGLAAGIYLIAFFVFDAPGETIVVRSYGLVVSIVSLLFVAFDKFIWKLPPVRSVFGWPVLHGTWKGTFDSSYSNPETGKKEGPTTAYLTVRQSYSSIYVR